MLKYKKSIISISSKRKKLVIQSAARYQTQMFKPAFLAICEHNSGIITFEVDMAKQLLINTSSS